MSSETTQKRDRAKFGFSAYEGIKGVVPQPFPRIMGPNAMKYLQEVVDSGLTKDFQGLFENKMCEMLSVKHCISTPGCTPALGVLGMALNLQPGDEVIFSPITDYGTIMGFLKANLIPVFADTELGSPNISAKTIEKCITDRTKAIVCVHKTGLICDMDPIVELAKTHKLVLIEDVCQAFLGKYKGRYAGTLADVAAYSFDSEKTVGSDMGGALTTNNTELADYARFVGHSRGAENIPGYGRVHNYPGQAYRIPICSAAVTLAQLEIAQENVTQRDKMIRYLTSLIKQIDGIIPLEIPAYQDVYSCWMTGFNLEVEKFSCTADKFAAEMAEAGISTASRARYYLMPQACTFLKEYAEKQIYPYSMPTASRTYKYGEDSTPNAKAFLDTFIRWVTFCEKYTEKDCELVANIIYSIASKYRK